MELNAEIAWANPGPQQDLFGACEEGDVQGSTFPNPNLWRLFDG